MTLPSRPTLAPGTTTYLPEAISPFHALDRPTTDLLNAALAALPPGSHGSVLLAAGKRGIEALVAIRQGEHFQVAGRIGKPWAGEVEAGVQVLITW